VAADVQRPAAVEQLRVLAGQIGVPFYSDPNGRPPRICERSLEWARDQALDVAIFDTAGRLHIDEALMEELRQIMERTHPTQIYLVCDAMTGQDAVNSAKEFNDRLQIDGVILTKLDGDARGGAALSVKFVTGKPIRFIGVGEQVDRLEEFHPERMADRILGMGDVRTLVEKAQEAVDAEQARRFQEKIRKQTLNLDDFLQQLQQVKKMGPLSDLLRLIPGMAKVDVDSAQEELPRIQGIIHAMTPQEREDPEVMDASRRRRIAAGSATTPAEVNQLLKQFRQMKKYLKHFGQAGGLAGAASMLGEASGSAPAAAGARGLRLRHGGRRKKHHRR
jgi:signal recognition particle subunit SRP54